ncbi:MAG: hypothetical protein MUO24_05675, partial [Desulfobacterales bacterium]|nr:hypothetical protein [Desulfobacterales bacterium]
MNAFAAQKCRRNVARCFFAISPVLLVLFSLFVWAGVAFSIESEECLKCHGSGGILKMSSEERLKMVRPTPGKQEVRKGASTLYVDYERFRSTVHRELQCVDCHTDIEALPHAQRLGIVNCAECHDTMVGQYEKSKHAKVSHRLCFECHNPHATTSFREL